MGVMSELESVPESEMDMIKNNGDRHNGMFVHQFLRTISKMLHAGDFYEGLPQERAHTPPVVFLLICSVIFTILSSIFVLEKKIFFALVFFLNAFSMPFITAFILYLVTMLLCKNLFTYKTLFGIAAYANIILLFSWIPGVAGPAHILKFCLIGLGMVKIGRISYLKAFACLLCAGMAMLFLLQLLGPFLGQK
jgi:uncharacterized integral membrane protein